MPPKPTSATAVARYGFSPTGQRYPMKDEMIALRDKLGRGLGFALRRCSLGRDGECWENKKFDYEYKGKACSSYHCCRFTEHAGTRLYSWPEGVEEAAHAIELAQRKAKKQDAP